MAKMQSHQKEQSDTLWNTFIMWSSELVVNNKKFKMLDIMLMKHSNKYNIFQAGEIWGREGEKGLQGQIVITMLTESRLCFKGIPEVTKSPHETTQSIEVNQSSPLPKLFLGLNGNTQAAPWECDQKALSLLGCSFPHEHRRAPKTNNWPYKWKHFIYSIQ